MTEIFNRSITRTVIIAIALVSFCAVASTIQADESNPKVGTRAFNFLKRDIGARAVGMGGALTGLSDDESALFYNPAGIALLEGRRGILSYQNFIAGISSGFVGYIHPTSETARLGGFINYINYGEFIRTDISGLEQGTFGATSLVIGGHYSRVVSSKLQAGGNLKLIYANWDSFTATGLAVDLGLRYTIKKQPTVFKKRGFGSVGLTVQNLGKMLSAFTVNSEKEPLPVVVRLGVAGRPRGTPVTISADAIAPADNDVFFAIGVEYTEIERLALRFGWSSLGKNYKTETDNSSLAGFSFGIGFHFERMKIEYSFTPMNDLGEAHRLTVNHQFDSPLE